MKPLVWVKLQYYALDTAKISYMEDRKDGKTYSLFWIMLQTLAGEINDGGKLYLSSQIPFTAAILARRYGLKDSLVEKALDLFERLDLISRENPKYIQILTWDDDQETEKLEAIRESGRRRAAAYRERQRVKTQAETGKTACIEAPQEIPRENQEEQEAGTLSPAVEAYQKAFGQVSFGTLQALKDAEEDWGSDQVCRAVRRAQYKNISHIAYIIGILRNGGVEEGAMTAYERPGVSDEEFERMLRKAAGHDDGNLDADDDGSLAVIS